MFENKRQKIDFTNDAEMVNLGIRVPLLVRVKHERPSYGMLKYAKNNYKASKKKANHAEEVKQLISQIINSPLPRWGGLILKIDK